MILKAKHNTIIYPFFQRYCKTKVRKHFQSVFFIGDFIDRNLPLLLIANHIGWWDGFWAAYLNFNYFNRRFHFMMLEEQLRKHWYFNYSGGYSVNKKSKSIIETINYTVELLKDKNNMVLLFPQGRLNSMHDHKIVFEKGIERVLNSLEKQSLQVVFSAFLVDYFSKPKPGLYIYFEEYTGDNFNQSEMEKSYNLFYQKCIETQTKKGE